MGTQIDPARLVEPDPTMEAVAALGHVLDGYADLRTVSRDLAQRAHAPSQLTLAEFTLQREKFGTVEDQIQYLRSVLRWNAPVKSC